MKENYEHSTENKADGTPEGQERARLQSAVIYAEQQLAMATENLARTMAANGGWAYAQDRGRDEYEIAAAEESLSMARDALTSFEQMPELSRYQRAVAVAQQELDAATAGLAATKASNEGWILAEDRGRDDADIATAEEKLRMAESALESYKESMSMNNQGAESLEQEPVRWNVEMLEPMKNISPSQFHPEKKWMATHFNIERPDGSVEEIESTRIIFRIKSVSGEDIEVPAFAAHHILSLHMKNEEAGSNIENTSLEEAFNSVAAHLPETLPFDGDVAAMELDMQQVVGTEGVSSQEEMLEKGVITAEEMKLLSTAKDDVFRLNLEGTDAEKQEFIDGFNAQMSANLKLGIRGGAITPFFSAERQETTKMFVVVAREKDENGTIHNKIATMAPGRHMEKLPNDRSYSGQLTEGASSVSALYKKMREGEVLSKEELELMRSQHDAQECWWDAGFVVPPLKL